MGHGYYVSAKSEQHAKRREELRCSSGDQRPPVTPRSHGRILKAGE